MTSQTFFRPLAAALTRRPRRFTWSAMAALALLGLGLPNAARAQRVEANPITMIDSLMPDGSVKKVPLARTGFSLFAEADIAVGSLRDAGTYRSAMSNQGGPNGEANLGGRIVRQQAGIIAGGVNTLMFENGFVFGAPPSEFRKIRALHQGVNNMQGTLGYTVQYWYTVSTPNVRRVGAADGQFGNLFSGLAVAFGQGCRDDTEFFREGVSLLPMRDCPGTFGAQGFRGKLVVPDSIWLNTFNQNKSAFRWDDWRLSPSRLDASNFLGTTSTYGFLSDYNREQKLRYGSVVPGGAGSPTEGGYPLGIEIRTDAWTFNSPATRNVQFYQVTLVNKSAAVYGGTGVDYDSLYFGSAPGFAWSSQNNHSVYFDFSTSTFYTMRAGISGRCGTPGFPRTYAGQPTASCPNSAGTGAAGSGIFTWTWLKSPLGDMRNKRFSNPADPYFNPTSPLADDTIMFNHSKPNGFGNFTQNIARSTRAGFGMISSTEDNYLDGRSPAEVPDFLYLFAPEQWNGSFPSATEARFNKFVPGNTTSPYTGQPYGRWDYNNDGIQDTISVPACGVAGCAAVYGDSIAGGYRNNYRNILNTVTAGPFKLRAGDTTQFLWAYSFGTDTISVRQNINGAITSYMTNYEGPTPMPFPEAKVGQLYTVASAELIDSTRSGSADGSVGPQITIRVPSISAVDPYMVRAVEKIRLDSINDVGRVRTILRLNPGLLARLRARANDNLSSVYIFKSCDLGTTFTTTSGNSATCTAAPAASPDGAPGPFSWRPWTTIAYTAGIPASTGVSEFVQGGKSYFYSFVTRTRGFRDFNVIDSVGGAYVPSNVEDALGIPRDTINSPLTVSGPSTITVYAPITNAAGRSYATVDTATASGVATQSLAFNSVGNNVTGVSRLVFANQFIVRKTIDTVTSATTTTISARYVIPRAATSPTGTPAVGFVAREQTFTTNANIPFSNAGTPIPGTLRGVSGSSRVFQDTIASTAGQVGYVWVTSDNKPIFGINNQLGLNQTRDQIASPLYPGYLVSPRDSIGANGFREELIRSFGSTAAASARDRNFIIRAPGDTLRSEASQFAPQVRALNLIAGTKRTRGGAYELSWLTDPWGPGAPFRLDPVTNLQATINASLATVAGLATTVTETSAAVAAQVGATPARPLIRVRVPFTMTYKDTDGRSENVRFAMLARPTGSTRLIGSGNDTIRVATPDSLWMPGDTLYALHKVEMDSTVGTGAAAFTVVAPETIGGVAGFRPIPTLRDSVGLNRLLISCNTGGAFSGVRPANDAATCNPVALLTRGANAVGGYLPVGQGWKQAFEVTRVFDPRSTLTLTAKPFSTGNAITKKDLAKVSVVPNPYIVRSSIDEMAGRDATPRIFFTGVPEEGVLRVYSASGQWLQELTWTRSNLIYQGNDSPSGDLPYNLRSREGLNLSSGLYFYVLTATGPNGKNQVQRGKFVIIR